MTGNIKTFGAFLAISLAVLGAGSALAAHGGGGHGGGGHGGGGHGGGGHMGGMGGGRMGGMGGAHFAGGTANMGGRYYGGRVAGNGYRGYGYGRYGYDGGVGYGLGWGYPAYTSCYVWTPLGYVNECGYDYSYVW
jgi:hypothetical protein